MKALILNGSAKDDAILSMVHELVVDELKKSGWVVDSCTLHAMKIAGCLGCFGCWTKTPGVCVIPDAGRDVARKVIQSDLVVLLTPVTFGGYSSTLKKAVDRLIPLLSPFFVKIDGKVHHKSRYPRYPVFVGIGILPRADEESARIFSTLIRRNAINSHSTGHAALVVSGNMDAGTIARMIWETINISEVQNEHVKESASVSR